MKKLIAALLMLPVIPLTYSVATAQNAPQGDAALRTSPLGRRDVGNRAPCSGLAS